MRAEVLRELGRFQDSLAVLKLLKSVSDPDIAAARDTIADLGQRMVAGVAMLRTIGWPNLYYLYRT
jgi:hypothetical protein